MAKAATHRYELWRYAGALIEPVNSTESELSLLHFRKPNLSHVCRYFLRDTNFMNRHEEEFEISGFEISEGDAPTVKSPTRLTGDGSPYRRLGSGFTQAEQVGGLVVLTVML